MKKLNEKQKKIINIVVISALTIILGLTVFNMTKVFIERRKTKTVTASQMIEPDAEKTEIIEEDNKEDSKEDGEEEAKTNKTNKKTTSTTSTNTNNNSNVVSNKQYYIKVNYGANVVTVYTKDSEGQYTVPVKAMICSTGRATPRSGTYAIKGRWRWLALVGGVYGQYCTQITGNILFHSVPYLKKGNPGSLEYWEYDKLRNSMFCRMC